MLEKLQILEESQQHSLDSHQTKASWLFTTGAQAC